VTHEEDRLLPTWEVAFRLGYRTTDVKPWYGAEPKTPAEIADARAMNTFYVAKSTGDVPPPDFYRGKNPLWKQSTIRKLIAEGGGKLRSKRQSRRGRQAIAKAGDVEGEGAAHA
jgi:hypothetical protein